jgi:hypothetical protein
VWGTPAAANAEASWREEEGEEEEEEEEDTYRKVGGKEDGSVLGWWEGGEGRMG